MFVVVLSGLSHLYPEYLSRTFFSNEKFCLDEPDNEMFWSYPNDKKNLFKIERREFSGDCHVVCSNLFK